MPLDAICLGAFGEELAGELVGARVNKINQPEKDRVILQLSAKSGTCRLLISINQGSARVCLTDSPGENPSTAPSFCMLLRKYLSGARIISVSRPKLERMLEIEFSAMDDMGVLSTRKLICELMGRNSNVILTDAEGRITDCLKKVDFEMSAKRQVLPGLFYHEPPVQDKPSLDSLRADDLSDIITRAPEGVRIDKYIISEIAGISPLIARETAYSSAGDGEARFPNDKGIRKRIVEELEKLAVISREKSGEPWIVEDINGDMLDYSFKRIEQYGTSATCIRENSFSGMIEHFYAARDLSQSLNRHSSELRKLVERTLERTLRKKAQQELELEKTYGREELRKKADILGAFAYRVERGEKSVILPNLYGEEGSDIEIKLDEALSPQQNVKAYYKEYSKLKNAEEYLTRLIAEDKEEAEYLSSVADELDRAPTLSDIAGIREELVGGGYIRSKEKKGNGNKKKKQQSAVPKPMIFTSPGGYTVAVGRNNLQNDKLTLHEAGKNDIWFHTQKIPGSHVILFTNGEVPGAEDISFAAFLAAKYSKAADSPSVNVDTTAVRNVKKPNGAKPGMVIYDKYKTITVKQK